MTLLGLSPIIEELLLASVMVFITSLFYRFLMDQNKMRDLKNQQDEKQKRMKELQKTNPEEANNVMKEILGLTNKRNKLMMKPMLVTFIVVGLALSWMSGLYSGFIPLLPFVWPSFMSWFIGVEGLIKPWLAWYIVVSFPLNSIFRKILGVEI
ncbi:MAG: EMC3/TMCO1 family protein [Candidatus Aenigmatarchaeota archaeon]